MENPREGKQKVLIAEASAPSRTLLTEVLRSQGFTDVQAVASLKDAIGVLEVEPVFWLITSVFPSVNENLLQILKLSCMVPTLRNLHISAFVEKGEMVILPEAFELGLLSYHSKPYTKDSLLSEFSNVVADFDQLKWNTLPIASGYLRRYLTQAQRYEDLVVFERQLLKLLPGDLQQLLNLVAPLVHTERLEEAQQILAQTVKLDPQLQKQVNGLSAQFFPDRDVSEIQSKTNILGIKTAIIVDNDSTVQGDLKKVLSEMGVEEINIFDDGLAALTYLKDHPNPDVIIHEWKIPKITGPLFLQKARALGGKNSPFIACSSLIEKADVPFLREMGIAHVLKKPIQRDDLIKGIAWTIQQDRRPTDKVALERKIRQKIAQKNLPDAEKFIALYLNDPAISVAAKQLVRAEVAYAQGDYEKARDLSVDAMKQGGESILVLNLLGKTMLQLRVMETALKCFERAQKLAPANIERLCQMAEIYAELGDDEASEQSLEKVDDLDPHGDAADESRAKIAINQGDSASAKSIMEHLESIDSVIAYMNNRAIAMARCGYVSDGILQYKRTIESIPDNHPDVKSIVLYNIALAYLRNQEVDLAKEALTDPVHASIDRMKDKVNKLLGRITGAEAKGETLHMAPVQNKTAPREDALLDGQADTGEMVQIDTSTIDSVLMAVEGRPGDRGVYMVYQSSVKSTEGSKMLANPVNFRVRKVISKGNLI